MEEDVHELKSIIDNLARQADDNLARAYKILGAKPGPGLDLEIWPVEPICGQWYVQGLTVAGKNFVRKLWQEQPFSNYHLGQLKREAQNWNLKYHIKLTTESINEPKRRRAVSAGSTDK